MNRLKNEKAWERWCYKHKMRPFMTEPPKEYPCYGYAIPECLFYKAEPVYYYFSDLKKMVEWLEEEAK